MASAISSLLGSSASSGTNQSTATAAANATANTAPSEEVFLQLLVSQIQNQDPLNPTDSTQFVSQLAQFSELEQVVAIRSDIETAMNSNTPSTTDPGNASAAGTSTDSANPASSSTGASGTSNNLTGTSTN